MSQNPADLDAPIQATARTLAIVEEIRRRDGAGTTELADHFGFSKSTVHDHLATLVQKKYLRRRGNEYEIGLRFLSLGGYAREQQELFELARPEITDLAEETGEAAKLVVEEYGRGIYLYQARGEQAVRTDSHVGTRVYLHSCGVGKAILANLPRDRVDEIVDAHGLPKWTEYTIADREALDDELARIRDRGYAVDNEERIRGLRCVAVPLIKDDEVIGSISVSGPTKRFDEDVTGELAELLQSTARVIEINVTYR